MQQPDDDIYGTDKYFRIDALAGQLARGVETNMDVSNGLSQTFQEGLRFIMREPRSGFITFQAAREQRNPLRASPKKP